MQLRESSNKFPAGAPSWWRADAFTAIALFLGTALVVTWQNLRLGVLWDLSYVLENAHRISLGDIPYRDFPFPYAPITFLIQAGIIKLTGHAYFHHVIYSALAGGTATVISWRILLNVLRGDVRNPRLVAFLFAAPLMVLGVYCICPHPFYDPDCTIVILIGILLLQRLDGRGVTAISEFCCGAVLVVPLFVKQNTGLFFLAGTAVTVAVLISIDAWRGRRIVGYFWIGAGAASLLAVAFLLIHKFFGLHNYWHWTFQFAAERRAPDFRNMLQQFENSALPLWIASVTLGGILTLLISRRVNSATHPESVDQKSKWISAFGPIAVVLMSAPFVWTVVYLFLDDDSSSRAERLLALWPIFVIISAVIAFLRIRTHSGVKLVLPFILICIIEGAFLSQQLWGSTYALWPFLLILIAMFVGDLASSSPGQSWIAAPLAIAIAISLLVSGGFYVWSHERLDYVDVWDGAPAYSTLPSLEGLRMRGSWIPQFEELVRFSEKEIPRDDGLVMIPGEDLFYYSTGRHPRFPVIMFDHTVNPYSPEQVLALCSAKNIRWLVVKRNLQLQEKPYEDESQTIQLLQRDFQSVARLENYDVYKRK